MDQSQIDYVKGAIEAILFVSEKSVTTLQIKDIIKEVSSSEIEHVIALLKNDYAVNTRGMAIAEIAGGYQMLSRSDYAGYIREFYKTRTKEKLSRPSLETMAIVAYKQPVSRADIEMIRGVNSDGVMAHLLSKGLVKIVGRKEVPGRPFLYGTTKEFLEYFGLKSLEDLPKMEEFAALTTQEVSNTETAQSVVEEPAVSHEQEEQLKASLDAFEQAALVQEKN